MKKFIHLVKVQRNHKNVYLSLLYFSRNSKIGQNMQELRNLLKFALLPQICPILRLQIIGGTATLIPMYIGKVYQPRKAKKLTSSSCQRPGTANDSSRSAPQSSLTHGAASSSSNTGTWFWVKSDTREEERNLSSCFMCNSHFLLILFSMITNLLTD